MEGEANLLKCVSGKQTNICALIDASEKILYRGRIKGNKTRITSSNNRLSKNNFPKRWSESNNLALWCIQIPLCHHWHRNRTKSSSHVTFNSTMPASNDILIKICCYWECPTRRSTSGTTSGSTSQFWWQWLWKWKQQCIVKKYGC